MQLHICYVTFPNTTIMNPHFILSEVKKVLKVFQPLRLPIHLDN